MSQIYGTTKESNNLSPVTLSPAERDTGMTTGESATHMDTSSPDYTGTEKKKTSLIGKVKAKAKKLKSKLKPGHNEGENPTSPTQGAQADYSSSASSSDGDEEAQELAYTPLSNAVNVDDDKTTAAATRDLDQSGNEASKSGTNLGTGYAQEDRKFGLLDSPAEKGRLAIEDPSAPRIPLSQFKSSGPHGVEQAVPTEYNYYNKDPVAAMSPNPSPQHEDSQTRKEETPAALGGASAGVAPILSESRAFGSDHSKEASGHQSFSSGEFSRHDSSNKSMATDKSAEDREATSPESMLAPQSTDTEARQSEYNPFDDVEDTSNRGSNQDVGMSATKNISNTLAGTKDAALDKLGYGSTEEQKPTFDSTSTDDVNDSSETQKPIHQRAYEGLTGATVGVGQKLGVYKEFDNVPSDNQTTNSSTEPSMAQKAYQSVGGTKDAASAGENTPGEPTMVQKAYDTVVGAKDAAASKLGGTTSTGTSSDSKTDKSSFFNSSAAPVDEYAQPDSATDSKPITQKAGETAATWKDSIASTLGLGGSAALHDQTGRDLTASSGIPADQKPLTEKLTETGVGLKETVASKLGYGGSATHTPGEEMTQSAADRAVSAKNVVASKIGQADQALSSDPTPVSQKAADTMYTAKDTTVSSLTPNEDDKALSQTVTESISSLPTLLSEKLGFGNHSSQTTTTKDSEPRGDFKGPSELDVPVSSSPANISTDSAADTAPATSPGIMNRVTGVVSSLFGGPAKKPTNGGDEYSPSVSPSGAGRPEFTDPTPMVTDTSGRRSSPAA